MFGNINVRWLLIIISILTLISGLTTIICVTKFKHKPKKIPIIITLIGIVCVFAIIIAYCIAIPHGLYTTNVTISQLSNGIANTPIEDELPEDLSGCIIIFYKFGCKDCEAIYDELSAHIKTQANVYWVSSRSKQGQLLVSKYNIDHVPTGIYIMKDSDDGSDFVKKRLTKADANDNPVLNTEGLNRLLYLQEQNR